MWAERVPITAAALCEQAGSTVVYTALDPETGMPADPVEVTTGISDGIYAQILTGPEPGDTVHYSYYEAPELDHTVD